jgi:hypothetical protein
MNAEMNRCIAECQNCHNVCVETITHCLQKGGEHAGEAHIRLMLDCVEICQTSANFMLRGSEAHGRVCAICSIICEQCAQDCARFKDDAHMVRCAETCRLCAESCRRMAGMAA